MKPIRNFAYDRHSVTAGIVSDDVLDFLALSPFASLGLHADERFTEAYRTMAAATACRKVTDLLESIL